MYELKANLSFPFADYTGIPLCLLDHKNRLAEHIGLLSDDLYLLNKYCQGLRYQGWVNPEKEFVTLFRYEE